MKFALRVANLRLKLTDTEDDIADYILHHKTEVAKMKIVILAERFYTVPNTIIRFCHKLGYEGFAELKVELKNESLEENKTESPAALLLKTFDLIDPEREEKLVALFQKAHAVNFYAQDQTQLVAQLSLECFQVLDSKFHLLRYEQELASNVLASRSNDIYFFISMSGETSTVLNLASFSKTHGNTVISLTSLSDNTLARLADIALYAYIEPHEFNSSNITDKTPLLIILRSLFESYCWSCKNTQK